MISSITVVALCRNFANDLVRIRNLDQIYNLIGSQSAEALLHARVCPFCSSAESTLPSIKVSTPSNKPGFIVVMLLISAVVVAPLWLRLISEHKRLESAHRKLSKVAYTDRETGGV